MSDAPLRPVDCLNDYLAILMEGEFNTSLDIQTSEMNKYKNVGSVVGIGPGVKVNKIELGDKVIVRKNTYLTMTPEEGSYAGKAMFMVREPDLVAKVPFKSGETRLQFSDEKHGF